MIKQINIKTCLSIFGIAALVILSLLSTRNAAASNVIPDDGVIEIVGRVLDTQGQPIEEAEIRASIPTENGDVIIAEGESNNDGTWSLTLELLPEELFIEIDRAHFHTVTLEVPEEEIQQLKQSRSLVFEEIEMERKVDAGFWAATAVFLMVLIIIATEKCTAPPRPLPPCPPSSSSPTSAERSRPTGTFTVLNRHSDTSTGK